MSTHATTPNVDTPQSALAALFEQFGPLFHSVSESDNMLELINDSGLTVPQLMTLRLLRCTSASSVSEIASRTRLSKPATSHLVDRLVALELVERIEDPNDRRQKQISLSPKARQLTDQLMSAQRKNMEARIALLSPTLVERLTAVVSEAIAELRKLPSSITCTSSKEAVTL